MSRKTLEEVARLHADRIRLEELFAEFSASKDAALQDRLLRQIRGILMLSAPGEESNERGRQLEATY